MYLDFYGFTRAPFGSDPITANELFLADTHREALATFVYGVVSRKPIIMVTGDVGVGKTTVLRTALTHLLNEPLVIIGVPHPVLRPDEVLREIGRALHMERADHLTIAMLERVHDAIKEVIKSGKRIIFIIDEAQEVPHETLEFIRLMSNMEAGVTGGFQIILVGQPELERTLAKPSFRHLRQRIALRGTLKPLSKADAADYLKHRLELAGGRVDTIMSEAAIRKIVSASRCIPRRLNVIADNALLAGFAEEARPITPSHVRGAVREIDAGMRFQWVRRYARPAGYAAAALAVLVIAGSIVFRPSSSDLQTPADAMRPPEPKPVIEQMSQSLTPGAEPVAAVASTVSPPDAFLPSRSQAPAAAEPPPVETASLSAPPPASPGIRIEPGRPETTPRTELPPMPASVPVAPANTNAIAAPAQKRSKIPGDTPDWLPYAHRLETGETVKDVLMRTYGSYNQDALFLFHALNSDIEGPESVKPGDVIWVPVRKDRESGNVLSSAESAEAGR